MLSYQTSLFSLNVVPIRSILHTKILSWGTVHSDYKAYKQKVLPLPNSLLPTSERLTGYNFKNKVKTSNP